MTPAKTSTRTSYALEIRIPATRRRGVLYLRSSDFRYLKDYVLLHVLPKEKEIIVTKFGVPEYVISQPKILVERVEYSSVHRKGRFSGGFRKKNTYFVRISDFFTHNVDVLELLTKKNVSLIVVTWFGWPDFVVKAVKDLPKMEYHSVVPDRKEVYKARAKMKAI